MDFSRKFALAVGGELRVVGGVGVRGGIGRVGGLLNYYYREAA